MDKTFSSSTRNKCTNNNNLQGQQSTILLAENCKTSSSSRTQHLDVHYFFVTDIMNKGEVKVCFCPTHDMLGKFFTKPLQGTLFTIMRILNLPAKINVVMHRSVLEDQKSGLNESGNNEKLARERERKIKGSG